MALRATALISMVCLGLPAHAADPEAAAFRDAFLTGVPWSEVTERAAQEGAVNFYHWGGSDLLNLWMDTVAVPTLAEAGVTLNPVRIASTKDAVDLVLAERGAGRGIGQGSVDLIWLNGENFATLRAQGALFGGFAPLLPEAANIAFDPEDPRSQANLRDFGVPTDGAEMPWSGEQYVCAFNAERVGDAEVPSDFEDLGLYLKANPGKFTYVKPPHYIGNTFVQSVAYALNPDNTGAEPFQQSASELGAAELARLLAPAMDYLKAVEPYLNGEGRYPENIAALDSMFLNGEVDMACKFGIYAVTTDVGTGTWPEGAQAFVFPEGNMIKNKNFLAIPSNAPNPAGALMVANWMSSVDAQTSKLADVGMPVGIDPFLLDDEDAAAIDAASPGLVGITQAELDENAAPDTNATLVDVIEAVWLEVIERDNAAPLEQIVAEAYQSLGIE